MDEAQKKTAALKLRRNKLANSIVVFNYYEVVIQAMLLINAVVYPNYFSSTYFC